MLICLNSETLLLGMHSFVIVTHVRIRHWKEDSHCYTVQAAKVETVKGSWLNWVWYGPKCNTMQLIKIGGSSSYSYMKHPPKYTVR